MDNQSFARAAAPIRLYRTDAFFDLTTGAFIEDVTRSNNTGKIVLPNIDPTYTDEFVVGYARPLGERLVGRGLRACSARPRTSSRTSRRSDDADASGDFRYGNIPAFRKYKARHDRGPQGLRQTTGPLDVSYTLSRLTGNWDLDYATQLFYTSSYIEDGPGLYVEDPNRNGTLIGNRTHVGKIFANYTFPTHTILGGYLRVQSGRPWEARVFDPIYGTDYQYAETAGTPDAADLDELRPARRAGHPDRTDQPPARGPPLERLQLAAAADGGPGSLPERRQHGSQSQLRAGDVFAPPRRFIISAIFNF